MTHRRHFWMAMLIASLLLAIPAFAQDHPTAQNAGDMKFTPFPGMPTCADGAVTNGDPSKGPSIIYARLKAGCVFPWHWHTPVEHVMLVSGKARLQAKGEKAATLRAGAFAMLPSRHVHEFRCATACTLYVYSDAAFDMHYVDANGNELSPDDALKAVKEKPAKAAM